VKLEPEKALRLKKNFALFCVTQKNIIINLGQTRSSWNIMDV